MENNEFHLTEQNEELISDKDLDTLSWALAFLKRYEQKQAQLKQQRSFRLF